MKNRIKAPVMAVAVTFALSGCGLLDVDNPNSLVEESIQQEASANGVANGSLQLMSEALADVWEGPGVTSDELYWIGSRDAWGQLDNGFISNPENEFTDAAFPTLGRAAWMSQNAVEILTGHFTNSGAAFQTDLGRSLMFRGVVMMVIAESQADMTFSYKMVDGAAVSSGAATIGSEGQIAVPTMDAVMGLAISSFDEAVTHFTAQGETDLLMNTRALRARAYMSREIMAARSTPNAATALPFANAIADANAVLASAGNADYMFNLSYSAASSGCAMCGNINDRKENQIDLSLVTVDASNDINGINLDDLVSGEDDLALISRLNQWKGGSYLDSGDAFPDLTVTSARLMQLILAEADLAGGGGGPGSPFETAINAIRSMDGEVPFVSGAVGGPTDMAMLQHTRRVNTVLMGLRLPDMYRWDIAPGPESDAAARWAPGSDADARPGSMLPITIIEIRANCNLNSTGCSG
jgi:starch-binding outer membrane protein, SusD/RagB family